MRIPADSKSILNTLKRSAVDDERILSGAEIRQSIRRWEGSVSDPDDKGQAVRHEVKQVQRQLLDCTSGVQHKDNKFDSCEPDETERDTNAVLSPRYSHSPENSKRKRIRAH